MSKKTVKEVLRQEPAHASVKQVLIDAKRLLETVGWCQGDYIRWDSEGNATAFCAVGDLEQAVGAFEQAVGAVHDGSFIAQEYYDARSALNAVCEGGTALGYNDGKCRTKEEVLALYDRAIAAQKE